MVLLLSIASEPDEASFCGTARFFYRLVGCHIYPRDDARNLLQGIEVVNRQYSGGWFDWFTPFSVFCGLITIVAYSLLGSCWLLIKLPKPYQRRYYATAKRCALLMVVMVGILSLWLPLGNSEIAERWFSFPQAFLFLLILLALDIWFTYYLKI